MKINSASYQTTNFKSAYPVVHWVAETNGSYAPSVSHELTQILQQKFVRALNKAEHKDGVLKATIGKIKDYLARNDRDFRQCSRVRTFYRRYIHEGAQFEPVSYIISGRDIVDFEDKIAKDIGRTKGQALDSLGTVHSAESRAAVRKYDITGLNFVQNNSRQIKDNKGMPYALHTKFEIVRGKNGNIRDYRLVDARFLPAKGENNPIEKYKKYWNANFN